MCVCVFHVNCRLNRFKWQKCTYRTWVQLCENKPFEIKRKLHKHTWFVMIFQLLCSQTAQTQAQIFINCILCWFVFEMWAFHLNLNTHLKSIDRRVSVFVIPFRNLHYTKFHTRLNDLVQYIWLLCVSEMHKQQSNTFNSVKTQNLFN